MKILITGGSGFIGTNLIAYYLERGEEVLNIDSKSPRNKEHDLYWRECDIRDYETLHRIVRDFKPEYILHMAATTGLDGKNIDDYSSNTVGVENIIRLSRELKGIRKTIYTSTMLVCKAGYYPSSDHDYCATTLYGESKIKGELAVRNEGSDLNWTIIRPTSIWGPWFGRTYRDFFVSIYKGRYFNFAGGMCTKTYGYIGNVVYQIDSILSDETTNGKTLYVGDYVPTRINEWADEIASEFGRKVYAVPRVMVRLGAFTGDVLKLAGIRFPLNSFRFSNMTTDNILDLSSTALTAPKTKFSRSEGNRQTIEWMREHGFLG